MKIGDLVKLDTARNSIGLCRWKFRNHYPDESEIESNLGLVVGINREKYVNWFLVKQLSSGIVDEFIEKELILVQNK